jgi:predicted acyl esterase
MRLLIFTVLLLSSFAGCVGDNDSNDTESDTSNGLVPVSKRAELPYRVDQFYSHTLENGTFAILPGVDAFATVTLAVTEGGQAPTGVQTHMGLFFPEIAGCDWTATSLPTECQLPVIADVGPYYQSSTGLGPLNDGSLLVGEGDNIATQPAGRLGGFLIDNFVPHGYIVAQVSVLGTGDSDHCQDLMGDAEQAGIDAAVSFLGESAWSNGNVGLIGRSYDGGTAWEAATFGNPALKTIVPISGVLGQHDLMWRNGSAELRGPGVLWALYAQMTIDGEAEDAQQVLCADYLSSPAFGGAAFATGSGDVPYWAEREFAAEVIQNYEGSVYLVHGMQDWNVDNHQAFPMYQNLIDKGLDVKGLFGQWAHMYPDRISEHGGLPSGKGAEAVHSSVRYDWAQDLLEWFNFYLKEGNQAPALHAEVQDNMGQWRIEATFPPKDAPRHEIEVGGGTVFGVGTAGVNVQTATYDLGSFDEDVRISGNVQFHPTVSTIGSGGQLGATLFAGDLRIGHAVMDLRYHEGGKEMQTPNPSIPFVAKMQFFAMDAYVEAGTPLRLVVTPSVEDYLPSTTSQPITILNGVVRLPMADMTNDLLFTPPAVQTAA